MLPLRDAELVQILDASLADATARAVRPEGGSWLACRPGCTPCCHGVFRISALDAERLRAGLSELAQADPIRAQTIQDRAARMIAGLHSVFPGDPVTGLLDAEDAAWDTFADLPATDGACPVLDPASGTCGLYASRPLTCRIFGPPVLNEGGLGLCELCYQGASEAEILYGELHLQHTVLEAELGKTLAQELPPGETIIAWAVRHDP